MTKKKVEWCQSSRVVDALQMRGSAREVRTTAQIASAWRTLRLAPPQRPASSGASATTRRIAAPRIDGLRWISNRRLSKGIWLTQIVDGRAETGREINGGEPSCGEARD
jgi:hypothetical protein